MLLRLLAALAVTLCSLGLAAAERAQAGETVLVLPHEIYGTVWSLHGEMAGHALLYSDMGGGVRVVTPDAVDRWLFKPDGYDSFAASARRVAVLAEHDEREADLYSGPPHGPLR